MKYTTPVKSVQTMTVSHGETAEQRAERYRRPTDGKWTSSMFGAVPDLDVGEFR